MCTTSSALRVYLLIVFSPGIAAGAIAPPSTLPTAPIASSSTLPPAQSPPHGQNNCELPGARLSIRDILTVCIDTHYDLGHRRTYRRQNPSTMENSSISEGHSHHLAGAADSMPRQRHQYDRTGSSPARTVSRDRSISRHHQGSSRVSHEPQIMTVALATVSRLILPCSLHIISGNRSHPALETRQHLGAPLMVAAPSNNLSRKVVP